MIQIYHFSVMIYWLLAVFTNDFTAFIEEVFLSRILPYNF